MNDESNGRKWDFASIAPIVISLFALLVSVKSCHLADEVQQQSSKEYKQERWLILTGVFEEKGLGIKVKAIDSEKVFLEGKASFPKSIYKEEIPINSDGDFLHMGSVGYDLKKFIASKIPKKEGFAKVSSGKIPLYIQSYYAVKGETYTDISLYMLNMTIVVSGEEYKDPHVNLEGLIFVERYRPDVKPDHELLDKFINEEIGLYLPPKAPQ
ncbi:hypothetical protein ABMY44_02525 [Pseudoalteromonas sp. Cnat2-41]|uniref:hypothetical protein n=1 Tax=unclassified Pseudoalteromonas TaxID=194690 RepID=UPI001EF7690A|nr:MULTISPECIES: hypothetical protein [unclassified Pseudoalteromonas]MCF2861040.1 hypothetical protein [Pseudoalteromonas sp. CNAT2-18]MCG7556909.1 hypothetical protein [Pseudoalteromonas sp. CNAT2-18.1]